MSAAVESRRMRRTSVLIAGAGVATILGACGQRDSDGGSARPPVVVRATGVVTPQEVTVSPSRIRAGTIVLSVSNQDEDSQTVIVEGMRRREQVGPINPQDTATITAELSPGVYAVRARSEHAVRPPGQIEPARLVVGQRGPDRRGRHAAVAAGAGLPRSLGGRAVATTVDTIPPSRRARVAEDS